MPGHRQGRLRQAPAERFSGTEHVYDLRGIAERLRAEPHPATDGHRQITIAHDEHVAIVLFDLDAGGYLKDHVAHGLVTIQVVAGSVVVSTAERTHELRTGMLLELSPGVTHDLQATDPSEVLLMVHMRQGSQP